MINLFDTHSDFCNNHGVFHRCTLNGKDYFFTEERINDTDMPEGLYKAEIRSGWGGDVWKTIEPKVVFDHVATIISDKPFEFKTNGYIEIADGYTLDWDEENMD